ncbi:hypothetical protein [Cupriavidus sp. 2MCAB6]|uniref:hypothetical protein n=1 Tax=Cupriavidus sp. 2MCAB6 TaxID=3232981 RepID=UPI003F93176B
MRIRHQYGKRQQFQRAAQCLVALHSPRGVAGAFWQIAARFRKGFMRLMVSGGAPEPAGGSEARADGAPALPPGLARSWRFARAWLFRGRSCGLLLPRCVGDTGTQEVKSKRPVRRLCCAKGRGDRRIRGCGCLAMARAPELQHQQQCDERSLQDGSGVNDGHGAVLPCQWFARPARTRCRRQAGEQTSNSARMRSYQALAQLQQRARYRTSPQGHEANLSHIPL